MIKFSKANREYICQVCQSVIHKGEEYVRTRSKFKKTVIRHKSCRIKLTELLDEERVEEAAVVPRDFFVVHAWFCVSAMVRMRRVRTSGCLRGACKKQKKGQPTFQNFFFTPSHPSSRPAPRPAPPAAPPPPRPPRPG